MADKAISFQDIEAAAQTLSGQAIRTPLLENEDLNAHLKARVFIKPECLQVTGSFKFRGGYNRLANIPAEERVRGVVAWSSGNHAQGVAAAAQRLGINAAIVMPEDTPQVKVADTREYGAEIIFYNRYTESREKIGHALAKERGAVLVPSYDDPYVMAGQGTAGLEAAQDALAKGITFEDMLICCGGGGLSSGIAVAMKELMPATRLWTVEPADFDDTARSLRAGERLGNDPDARSICDALLSEMPGYMTFPILTEAIEGGLSVTDEDVRAAVKYAFETLKLVVEPGGAVALAALLSGKIDSAGKTICIIISGGNVDPGLFAEIIG